MVGRRATLRLMVTGPDGATHTVRSSNVPTTIGRDPHCHVVLHGDGISREHLLVYFDPDSIVLRDQSTNGCKVDGKPMPREMKVGRKVDVTVGAFAIDMQLVTAPAAIQLDQNASPDDTLKVSKAKKQAAEPAAAKPPPPKPTPPTPSPAAAPAQDRTMAVGSVDEHAEVVAPEPPKPRPPEIPAAAAAALATHHEKIEFERPRGLPEDSQLRVHRRLLDHLNLKGLALDQIGSSELRRKAEQVLDEILDDELAALKLDLDRPALRKTILDEVFGLGPLEAVLADDSISEVMVVGADRIFVEQNGRIHETNLQFTSETSLYTVIQRIVGPIGRHVDEGSPLVDARLKDGSRVNVIIQPISLSGSVITIRKFKSEPLRIEDLIRFNAMTQEMADFLRVCVLGRKNIVVAGGTGSGKTTLLNTLGDFIAPHERIVTIEDSAELRLNQRHVVTLEARPPNLEGKGEISIRELVKNALRMRPDRILVGECRGGEALDMLQAMNTGHDGSLTTIHANSTQDVISRLETMVLMSGTELPTSAVRSQIASAIDMILYQARLADGSRRVMEVSEVVEVLDGEVRLESIFSFIPEGRDDSGVIRGEYRSTGHVPTFIAELVRMGLITEEEALGVA